jgi:hypothetical protein
MLKKLIDWLEQKARVYKMENAIDDHAAAALDMLIAQRRMAQAQARMDELIADDPALLESYGYEVPA